MFVLGYLGRNLREYGFGDRHEGILQSLLMVTYSFSDRGLRNLDLGVFLFSYICGLWSGFEFQIRFAYLSHIAALFV